MTKETIKDNKTKLELCTGPHDFQPAPDTHKYRCTKCTGEIDADNHHWYCQGLTHASKPTPPLTEDEELEHMIINIPQL